MENMWPLYPNKLLNNWEHLVTLSQYLENMWPLYPNIWEHLVTLSQYLENMWPLYSNIWKTFNPHLIQYLGTCDHWPLLFTWTNRICRPIFEPPPILCRFPWSGWNLILSFIGNIAILKGLRFWRVWSLQWNLSLHWKRWSVCLAMLSEGILNEIESICSSVGKKGGKKWVQFVSVAANKIWASVRGKGTKKACRKITWPIFHSWRGLKILFPSFQLCGSITKQSFMVLLVSGLPTEIWPKDRDLCKKRPL